ncbi:copper transporter 4-like [Salvia divinorum]|uniref:Copper transporter 4-like n=1 Tax=Salvia divinorum TaxID=28513 RepID=A0ABD1GYE2_SALDI
MESSSFSSFWNWYLMRLLPGWPHYQSPYDYGFSLLLVFLLTFTAEFCSNYPVSRRSDPRVAALGGAALRALQMFMTYLAIIAIMATDFVFFAAAVAGHAAGNFVASLYQYHIEEVESALYDCSCGNYYNM